MTVYITDVDRDGDTGINDFLTLLGGWGGVQMNAKLIIVALLALAAGGTD